jgi:hypothetical protein
MANETNLSAIANLIGETLQGDVVYAAKNYNPLLPLVPMTQWQGDSTTYTYNAVTALPTATSAALDATSYTTSKSTYVKRTATLKNIYTQGNLAVASRIGAMNRDHNQVANLELNHSRAMGRELLRQISVESSRDVAIGATATTKGIDAVEVGTQMNITESSGILYFKFLDASDTLELSSDGGTSYGPAVTCDQDLEHQPMYDAAGNWIKVTFDVSDSAGGGDWTTTNAATGVTVSAALDTDGFATLCAPSQMIWGDGTAVGSTSAYTASDYFGGANGDSLSLKTFDRLIELVPWAHLVPGRCAFLMPSRTHITAKHLVGVGGGGSAGAGATVTEWMGQRLAKEMVGYSNIPFFINPDLPKNLSPGTTTDATTVYLVYFAAADGFHVQYDNAAGVAIPEAQTRSSIRSDADIGSEQPIPFYARWLPESDDAPYNKFRVDGYFSGILRNDQGIAGCQGITD